MAMCLPLLPVLVVCEIFKTPFEDRPMNDQIAAFTKTLSSLATEYSNPMIILDHIPVLKDHIDKVDLLIENKEIALGSLVTLFVLWRLRKRAKKRNVKNVAMVMPKPYKKDCSHLPEDHPMNAEHPNEAAEANLRLRVPGTRKAAETTPDESADDRISRIAAQIAPRVIPSPKRREARTEIDDLSVVANVDVHARPILTADEARMRVIVQAALADRKAPLLLMARVALDIVLVPAQDATGPARAKALAALKGKHVPLALFDRTGKIVVALDVPKALPVGAAAQDAQIVQQALAQAAVPVLSLLAGDGPAEVSAKLTPYLSGAPMVHATEGTAPKAPLKLAATQRVSPIPQPVSSHSRPARPGRPGRPTRPAAIAAE